MRTYDFDAVVIGTGCAGYNCADWLYDLGYKIDGCNLVLNSEQANAETAYQPNIETRTWWDTEWKSITLK